MKDILRKIEKLVSELEHIKNDSINNNVQLQKSIDINLLKQSCLDKALTDVKLNKIKLHDCESILATKDSINAQALILNNEKISFKKECSAQLEYLTGMKLNLEVLQREINLDRKKLEQEKLELENDKETYKRKLADEFVKNIRK